MNAFFYPSKRGINFAKIRGFKVTDYKQSGAPGPDLLTRSIGMRPLPHLIIYVRILLCCHIGLLLRQTQISRPICTDCLRHLRISAK